MGEMWANVLFKGYGRTHTGRQVREPDPRQRLGAAPRDGTWIGPGKETSIKDGHGAKGEQTRRTSGARDGTDEWTS